MKYFVFIISCLFTLSVFSVNPTYAQSAAQVAAQKAQAEMDDEYEMERRLEVCAANLLPHCS